MNKYLSNVYVVLTHDIDEKVGNNDKSAKRKCQIRNNAKNEGELNSELQPL